jgi:hypothetical protein
VLIIFERVVINFLFLSVLSLIFFSVLSLLLTIHPASHDLLVLVWQMIPYIYYSNHKDRSRPQADLSKSQATEPL